MPGRTPSLRPDECYDTLDKQIEPYSFWYDLLNDRPTNAGCARPRNCIHNGRIIPSEHDTFPYIAISYVWDTKLSFNIWEGRRVTQQALDISERLSQHTSLPLWIDAICIPQDDEPVKMQEIGKMAHIYRGAIAVLCLVPEVSHDCCKITRQAIALMETESYGSLQKAGDVYGSYMFATLGENECLRRMYGSGWWTRGWTFQEAVLCPETYLVGDRDETIPIGDVLKIAIPIRSRAASTAHSTLRLEPSIWDSLVSMRIASTKAITLGQAMQCVWRRNVTVGHDFAYALLGVCALDEIRPDYRRPLVEVVTELAETASAKGDYSWLRWCCTIDQATIDGGMSMVPMPENVKSIPTSSISKLCSIKLPQLPAPHGGDRQGVMIPYRSTGVVRWQSNPQSLSDAVQTLKKRGHSGGEIWDMLFGLQAGLATDIENAVGSPGIIDVTLSGALMMIDGTMERDASILDLIGDKPFTSGISFTNYSAIAASTCRDLPLVVMVSQGGTTVVPKTKGNGSARIHRLPLAYGKGRSFVMVVYDDSRYHASATGLMIDHAYTGSGNWQSCKFGSLSISDKAD